MFTIEEHQLLSVKFHKLDEMMDYSKEIKGECKLLVTELPFGSLHFDKGGTNYFGN